MTAPAMSAKSPGGLVIVGAGALESQVPAALAGAARRFLAKVRVCPESGCWRWCGAIQNGREWDRRKPRWKGAADNFRGRFWFDGRAELAHRASWILFRGAITDGLCVMHSECDNSLCVNPWHLGLGTPAENTADMFEKGRARGWAARPAHDGVIFAPTDDDVAAELFA